MGRMDRFILFGAGLLGLGGVAAAAAGAHATGDPRLGGSVALVCLTHAPALLALALHGRRGVLTNLVALALFVGATLFSVDIALRVFDHGRLFAMAAPIGGMIMMTGWAVLILSAFAPRR